MNSENFFIKKEAREEGIRIETLADPVEISGDNGAVSGIRLKRMEYADFGKDGRRQKVRLRH